MFDLLYTADVVIADISIHNANVFYELGVRHALRDRVTVLIRADASKVPFDLQTDRYLGYDAEDPAAARTRLKETIRQSQLNQGKDSPVYALLPGLRPSDPEAFRPDPGRLQRRGAGGGRPRRPAQARRARGRGQRR